MPKQILDRLKQIKVKSAYVTSDKVISDWGDLKYTLYHSNIMKKICWLNNFCILYKQKTWTLNYIAINLM